MGSTDFSDFILSKLTKASRNGIVVESLILRYQSLAIIYLNCFFLGVLIFWKFLDLFVISLPGDEVILTLTPIQLLSLAMLKKGNKDVAAALLIMAIHVGNFIASKVCNVTLGAAYLIVLLPCLAYFVSSSKKVYIFNSFLCIIQNFGHIMRIQSIFRVTYTDEQQFQIFTLGIVSFMYIILSWVLFGFQKYIETNLWQVAQLNYIKAENITKELVEAVESKDKVISSFSHEMRNPLNALNGSIDFLLKVVKESSYLKVLQNAKLSGEVLLNLVNNVLDAAKLKADKLDIVYSEENPHEIIKKALSINSQNMIHKNISSAAFIQKNVPQKLYMDSSRVLQIILNLLSNSIKFTKEGGKVNMYVNWLSNLSSKEKLLQPFLWEQESEESGPFERLSKTDGIILGPSHSESPTKDEDIDEFGRGEKINRFKNILYLKDNRKKYVLTDVDKHNSQMRNQYNIIDLDYPLISSKFEERDNERGDKGYLKFQITDSGCGIAQDNIPKLFTMFSQLENVETSRNEGTGLGLWICKQLCNKMGGDIKLFSQINGGTSVIFYIKADSEIPSSSVPHLRRINSDKLRALVVDDYAYNRDVHKLILEREGVEVSVACDGLEALEKYKAHEEGYFNFIMMDIQMPKMDGLTAAKEMSKFNAENHRRATDIYFVSGNYYSKNEAIGSQNSELENIQFLRKPIDLGNVRTIVHKYRDIIR